MKRSKYISQIIHATDVMLTNGLEQLVNQMSKNVHEVLVQTRIAQEWHYGAERNDALKHNPCLVPYEDLPDSEKEFDRNTSIETLKLILKLGFRIM